MINFNTSCVSVTRDISSFNMSQVFQNDTLNLNCTENTNQTFRGRTMELFDKNGEIRIPLYILIFFLSVIGNTLVIMTLVQNRRMRTVTNVFLLNLAISDLLLAVFCMPFTLIPQLMRNFIFGEFLCVSFRYLQAVSVAVSCFTLVTISTERYFAICHPLRSRRWQTLSHAYKTIAGIWVTSLIITTPIAISCKLLTLKTGVKGCREIWADKVLELIYSVCLVTVLLIIPLIIMVLAYGCISWKLWLDIRYQKPDFAGYSSDSMQNVAGIQRSMSGSDAELQSLKSKSSLKNGQNGHINLRHSNFRVSIENRKRVIKMLVVVVLEYFICWTPVYVMNTWKIVDYESIHGRLSPLGWSMVLLLAYSSSFVHPITYCFLNKNFRKAFVTIFKCFIGNRTTPCTDASNVQSTSLPMTSAPVSPTMKDDRHYHYCQVPSNKSY